MHKAIKCNYKTRSLRLLTTTHSITNDKLRSNWLKIKQSRKSTKIKHKGDGEKKLYKLVYLGSNFLFSKLVGNYCY